MAPDAIVSRPDWRRAAALVACTYAFFLLFAQFAFLELVRHATGSGLRSILAAQGLAGIAGSIAAALIYRPARRRGVLTGAFVVCALSAGLAPRVQSAPALAALAALTGAGLGFLTVTLASGLREIAGDRRLGLAVGVGTGMAYALGSLPWIFSATPVVQSHLAAIAAAAGALLAFRTGGLRDLPPARERAGPRTVAPVVLGLFALVWLDSAAFYVVQHTASLKAAAWDGGGGQLALSASHLIAALVAGWALDRGNRLVVLATAACLLVTACLALRTPAAWIGPVYAGAVSLYSATLVHFPARLGRPGVAALVFALCGWAGSGLGLGLAQRLETVPVAFALGALGAVVLALAADRRLAVAGVLLVAGAAATPPAGASVDALVSAGREVYIAEGCMHCHSQYVRPGTADELRWGPVRPLAELLAGSPPLPGNRRQGPDLQNVGNRRWPAWNRLHLVAPRRISPGSTMPAYAHLFGRDAKRGEALLAYLSSLGAETLPDRLAQTGRWNPPDRPLLPAAETAALFARLCANCHGAEGRGDGPLARALPVPPRDLRGGRWVSVAATADPATERRALARVVKFGLPGTTMAGHEYLSDAAVLSLAAHAQSLRTVASRP